MPSISTVRGQPGRERAEWPTLPYFLLSIRHRRAVSTFSREDAPMPRHFRRSCVLLFIYFLDR